MSNIVVEGERRLYGGCCGLMFCAKLLEGRKDLREDYIYVGIVEPECAYDSTSTSSRLTSAHEQDNHRNNLPKNHHCDDPTSIVNDSA